MELLKEDYVERIKNASPTQLIVITFELVIVNLEDAKKKNEDIEQFENHIRKAQDFLMQLMSSLDMSYQISNYLLNIYLYVNKLLHDSYFSKNLKYIDDSIEILTSLLSSFEFLAREEFEKNKDSAFTSNIFSGLTFENGTINEFSFKKPSKEFEV